MAFLDLTIVIRFILLSSEFSDARVKSLKPRCACTGVVLRLSDPPDMSIKVERQLHDMRILGRIVGCCVPVAHV